MGGMARLDELVHGTAVVLVVGLLVLVSTLATGSPVAADSGSKIAVDRSVDPDGFILDKARPRPASELPPVCVEASDEHPHVGLARVQVRNACTTPQRVKVLVAFWFDSACLIVPPNGDREYEYANSARFDGLEAC